MDVLNEMMGTLAVIVAAQIAVFVVVVVVLRRLLLGDTLSAVRRLKDAESELVKKEEAIRQKMEAQEQEVQRKRTADEQELQRRKETVEQDLARTKERMLVEAKLEADKIVSEAQLSKDRLREQLVRETDSKAVEFAGEIFKLVISKEVSEKVNAAFVDELIGALAEVDGGSVHVDGDNAEFIASHKLDPGQKAAMERLIEEKFGAKIRISEKVDEKLLAGVIIKLGSLEIDGSLLSRYREAVGQIKKAV